MPDINFFQWIRSALSVGVGSPSAVVALDGNGDFRKVPLSSVQPDLSEYALVSHDHTEFLTQAEIEALTAFAPSSHDHMEFLTQAEIEALPGFGGGGGVPVGSLLFWALASIPSGWYLVNGQTVSESSGVGTWALSVGQSSNGNGTVNVPDWRGLFPVAAGGSYALLSRGGANKVSLTSAQNGEHQHTITECWSSPWGVGGSANGLVNGALQYLNPGVMHISSSGSGSPHENRPPFVALNLIVYGG